jgi:site-specific recombinase XerC
MANNDTDSWFVPVPPAPQRQAYKDILNRLRAFENWGRATGRSLFLPDLVVYRDYLLDERKLAPTSVNAHVRTIRNRYLELLEDGTLRRELAQSLRSRPGTVESADVVEDMLMQIRVAVSSRKAILDAERPDVEYRRLRAEHIKALLASPDPSLPIGLRDIAIFALMFTTGLRASEVCALQVNDLYAAAPTGPALHVPEGRGCVERVIPYERLSWGLQRVEDWLRGPDDPDIRQKDKFPITSGPVFRGFYRGGKVPRREGLSSRSLDYIFNSTPIEYMGQQTTIKPMELRRAYARLLFEAQYELEAIKERLGIADNNTLMDYIGGRDASLELPPVVDILEEGVWFDT